MDMFDLTRAPVEPMSCDAHAIQANADAGQIKLWAAVILNLKPSRVRFPMIRPPSDQCFTST